VQVLPKYKWYLASAVLVAIARLGLVTFFLVLAIAPLGVLPTVVHRFIFHALVFFAGCALAALAIALFLRCPACRKLLMLTWAQDNPEIRRVSVLSWRRRLLDFFFPSEIIGREVRCARCSIAISLRAET